MKTINKNFVVIILILLIINLYFSNSKNTKTKNLTKKQKENDPEKKIDDIEGIFNWAKKNNIFIHPDLKLNKKNNNHRFYYFNTKNAIKNNTVIYRLPYNMMLSKESLEDFFKKKDIKKFMNLWQNINKFINPYIKQHSTRLLLYLSIIFENYARKKKGELYNKYKEYFDMYDDINLDNFPIFYSESEKEFLINSNFGGALYRSYVSVSEEYLIVKQKLNFTNIAQDNYYKYRVLTLSNSFQFNNTKSKTSNKFNELVTIPLIDCFNKRVNISNAFFRIILKDNEYVFEVYTNKDIQANEEIEIKHMKLSNSDFLLFYGTIDQSNRLLPTFYVDLINYNLQQYLGFENKTIDYLNNFTEYDINQEFFAPKVINSYKYLVKQIKEYSNFGEELAPYILMRDSLSISQIYYKKYYNESIIDKFIMGEQKVEIIKQILKDELNLIIKRINYLDNVINNFKNKTENATITKKIDKDYKTINEEDL